MDSMQKLISGVQWSAIRFLLLTVAIASVLLLLTKSFIDCNLSNVAVLLSSHQLISTSPSLPTLESFLRELDQHGTKPCHNLNTTSVMVFGLPPPDNGSEILLRTGIVHEIMLVSYDTDGSRRCHGGDFFEVDLRGAHWASRPPTFDMGDGSYRVELLVDDAFPGTYTLNTTLLFSNFHGLDRNPKSWAVLKQVISIKITFAGREQRGPPYLPSCLKDDFKRKSWHGRWIRTKMKEPCTRDAGWGRYRCLPDNEPCDYPWCDGPLGRLDSNGWVYSAHCRFHLWTAAEAWECLNGKNLFFWGDSNHQDTVRNLFNLVLGLSHNDVQRFINETVVNPADSSKSFNITSFFNGHYLLNGNNLGLKSLYNDEYRQKVISLFMEGGPPDVLVMNSGLHDGSGGSIVPQEFAVSAKNASKFWGNLTQSMVNTHPDARVIFRTTVAPAGLARPYDAGVAKMEVYNHILARELSNEIDGLRFVDAYDMTFPWHYDNIYSDGGHYGRMRYWYFEDVMLVHVLLNAICS